MAANVSEPAECEKLIQAARQTYGPVDVLVNGAEYLADVPYTAVTGFDPLPADSRGLDRRRIVAGPRVWYKSRAL